MTAPRDPRPRGGGSGQPKSSKSSGARSGSGARRPAEGAATGRTQNRGLWIGGALGLLVVVGVFVVALMAGGSDDAEPEARVDATAATSTTIASVPVTSEPIPPGDYTAFCTVLGDAVDSTTTELTPTMFAATLSKIDFEALVAAAPDGFRPDVELVRDSQPQFIELLRQVDSMSELSPGDFPEGVVEALGKVVVTYQVKCV